MNTPQGTCIIRFLCYNQYLTDNVIACLDPAWLHSLVSELPIQTIFCQVVQRCPVFIVFYIKLGATAFHLEIILICFTSIT